MGGSPALVVAEMGANGVRDSKVFDGLSKACMGIISIGVFGEGVW